MLGVGQAVRREGSGTPEPARGASGLASVLWRVSLPLVFVEGTETFDHLIDTLFLARVGVTELGAIAVADSMLLLFLVLPLGLVDGIQILTARREGEERPDAVGAVFNQGLLLVLLTSIACTVALKAASPAIAGWLVESDAVGDAVDAYLQIEAYGIGLHGVSFACGALLTSLGRTRALVPATLLMIATHVLLNYLLVLGGLGFPALGIRGAALASVGAELVSVAFLAIHLWRSLDRPRYHLFDLRRREPGMTSLLGRLSTPVAIQGIVATLRWFVFFLILERVSIEALAVANIVYTCYMVLCIPVEAFGETTCSLVSRFVAGRREHRIAGMLKHAIGAATVATAPFILAALVAPSLFVAVFSAESELMPLQSHASLRVVALAMLIAIPGELWFAAVTGTGDTAAALGIESALTLTLLGFTYASAIHLGWPMALVWLSLPVAWLVCLALSYGWMRSGIWRRLEI